MSIHERRWCALSFTAARGCSKLVVRCTFMRTHPIETGGRQHRLSTPRTWKNSERFGRLRPGPSPSRVAHCRRQYWVRCVRDVVATVGHQAVARGAGIGPGGRSAQKRRTRPAAFAPDPRAGQNGRHAGTSRSGRAAAGQRRRIDKRPRPRAVCLTEDREVNRSPLIPDPRWGFGALG